MACNVLIANSPIAAAAPKITSNPLKKTNTAKVALIAPIRSNKTYGLGAIMSTRADLPNSKTWNYRKRSVVVCASSTSRVLTPGRAASVSGTILNGAKLSILFAGYFDWEGEVVGTYPSPVEHGGKGLFSHAGSPDMEEGSIAAVVYRVTNIEGHEFDWMFAWEDPFDKTSSMANKVYTEIGEVGRFNNEYWSTVRSSLDTSGPNYEEKAHKLVATVHIEDGNSPSLKAIIKNA